MSLQVPQAKKVLQYKNRFKDEAEELLLTGFPSTILKLNTLLATPKFRRRSFSDIHLTLKPEPSDSVLDNGDSILPPVKTVKYTISSQTSSLILQSNKCLVDLIETVKPHMVKLVEDAKVMKMWISLMIPKMEDGNNFGVEIQEETLLLVQAIENSAARFYENISKYFSTRADIVKSILKHPEVEDFKQAMRELDETEYISMCTVMMEIRNEYSIMHDVFLKNLDKLKRPRSTQPDSLY